MALTRNTQQLQWSGSNSVTLSTSTETETDAVVFDATDVAAVLQISVQNQGTPTSGDTLAVRIKYTTGDILGDTGDDFDSSEHSEQYLLDTVSANFPGENPARMSISLNHMIGAKGFRLGVTWNSAAPGTRNAVVHARLSTQRAA